MARREQAVRRGSANVSPTYAQDPRARRNAQARLVPARRIEDINPKTASMPAIADKLNEILKALRAGRHIT